MASRLKTLYTDSVQADLKKTLELKNVNEVPRIEKVVINVGLGRAGDDKRIIEVATNTIRKVTGQQPTITFAKKSIANFKLREGQKNGLMVTLRDDRMYEFLDKLINVVLPRLRDFHGVNKKSFDNSGNYSLGLKEQSVFPEMSFEDLNMLHGMQITIVTTTDNKEHAKALLTAFGMPYEKGVSNAS